MGSCLNCPEVDPKHFSDDFRAKKANEELASQPKHFSTDDYFRAKPKPVAEDSFAFPRLVVFFVTRQILVRFGRDCRAQEGVYLLVRAYPLVEVHS